MTLGTKLLAAAGALLAATAATVVVYRQVASGRSQPNAPAAPATTAVTAAAEAPRVPNIVHWHVTYEDAERGVVHGRAIVDWSEEKAVVTLDAPDGKSPVSLVADDVTVDESSTAVTMRLRTRSPDGPKVKPPSTEGVKRIAAAAGQELTIASTNPEFSTAVKDKAAPDNDGVRVVLRAGPYGVLSGQWAYRADPLTRRNAAGHGRSGLYRILDDPETDERDAGFLGLQTGREEWWPIPTQIAGVMVMEEQLAAKGRLADYRAPLGAPDSEEKLRTRTLFVVGRDFPVDRQGRVLRGFGWDEADGIERYNVVAVSTDPNLDAKAKERIADGWRKIAQGLDDETKQLARDTLEAAVVVVRLKNDVRAGPKQFTWGGGAPASWFLQFGDNVAESRFVRRIRQKTAEDATSKDEYERTPWIFVSEQIAVEVETRADLPFEAVPVRMATQAMLVADTFVTEVAHAVPGRPRLYRTKLFPVAGAGGAGTPAGALALRPGDTLFTTVAVDDVAFVAPPTAKAVVLLTPDALARKDNAPAGDSGCTTVKLWKEALACAAKAHGISVDDFSTLPGRKLDPYRGVPMTLGDHAAMLLLRSAFLDLLQDQLKSVESIKVDDDVEGFREWVRLLMEPRAPAPEEPPVGWEKFPDYLKYLDEANKLREWLSALPYLGVKLAIQKLAGRETAGFGKGTYFGELSVPGPRGGTWQYFNTYWQDTDLALDRFFKGDRRALRAWRLEATRAVVKRYGESIRSTIATVKGIPDNDTRELLKLTGIGFGPVVAHVMPQLMKLEEGGGTARWGADFPARAAVANLHTFGGAVRAAEDYSSAQWRASLEIVSAFLTYGGAGALLGEVAGAAVSRIAGYGLLAWQAGHEIYDQAMVRSDLDLFFGAAGVLGTDRLEETNARKASIGDVVGHLATQFALDSVWGELKRAVPQGLGPRQSLDRSWRRVVSVTPAFAVDLPKRPRRPISYGEKILAEIRVLGGERALPRLIHMPLKNLKQNWSGEHMQPILRLAARGGTAMEAAQPMSRAQFRALVEARRLKREADGVVDPHADKATLLFGDPAPSAPPPLDKRGIVSGPPTPAGARLAVPPPPLVLPRPTSLVPERPLPLAGAPPRDNSWIAIKHADGSTVYYKTPGVDDKGKPLAIGGGVSADVYRIERVHNRPHGRLFDDDGTVLKVIKDDIDPITGKLKKDGFGSARDQIARMREAYENLRTMKAEGAKIEFPEILEGYPDASPPHLIMKRVPWEKPEYRRVDPEKLVKQILRPGKNIPPQGVTDAQHFEKAVRHSTEFPVELRRAVVELYFTVAAYERAGWDLSLLNLYFRNAGGKWVAGPLDIDHIVHAKRPAPPERRHATWGQLRKIRDEGVASMAADGRSLTTTFAFMEKSFELELGGNLNVAWIRYDPKTNTQQGLLIEPELIAKVFGEFKVNPRPPAR